MPKPTGPRFKTWHDGGRVLLCVSSLWVCACAQATDCSAAKPEGFKSFFERFSADAQFAQTRTVLPLRIRYWALADDDDGFDDSPEPTEVWVSREVYALKPSLRRQAAAAALEFYVDSQSPSAATVELSHRHAAPLRVYHFRLEQGCWKLWEVDASGE